MKQFLEHLLSGATLAESTAEEAFLALIDSHDDSVAAAFLTIFSVRSPTVSELSGFRQAVLSRSIDLDGLKKYDPLDLCGTGGDGRNTFNISTAASFVAAASGAKVAKHGNYAFSSRCGSSNVLEALGVRLRTSQDDLLRDIDSAGICFLHAPHFHPALKALGPVRRALGFRTVMNLLGPLVNPVSPSKQLLGVASLNIARLYAAVCARLPVRYTVVHSLDGYDEISLTDTVRFYTKEGERELSPESIAGFRVSHAALCCADTVEDGAKVVTKILSGEGTAEQESVVLANAAAAISAGSVADLADAFQTAREALHSGRAREVLNRLQQQK